MAELKSEDFASLVNYDPETGDLVWAARPAEMFASGKVSEVWNLRFSGRPAFATKTDRGYLTGVLFAQRYKAHRVAWLLSYGEWPSGEIDHINGDRSDNRLANLRDVSHGDNARNQKRHRHNTSGVSGVRYSQKLGKWLSEIRSRGSYIYLGTYVSKQEAISARKMAEASMGFHPNHGRS